MALRLSATVFEVVWSIVSLLSLDRSLRATAVGRRTALNANDCVCGVGCPAGGYEASWNGLQLGLGQVFPVSGESCQKVSERGCVEALLPGAFEASIRLFVLSIGRRKFLGVVRAVGRVCGYASRL